MKDLIERLRQVTEVDAYEKPVALTNTCREAAAALESLTAELDALREQLTHCEEHAVEPPAIAWARMKDGDVWDATSDEEIAQGWIQRGCDVRVYIAAPVADRAQGSDHSA